MSKRQNLAELRKKAMAMRGRPDGRKADYGHVQKKVHQTRAAIESVSGGFSLLVPQSYGVYLPPERAASYRYIGTVGMAPCVGAVIVLSNGEAFVAHFDSDNLKGGEYAARAVIREVMDVFYFANSDGVGWIVPGPTGDQGLTSQLRAEINGVGIPTATIASPSGDFVVEVRNPTNIRFGVLNELSQPQLFEKYKRDGLSLFKLKTPLQDALEYSVPAT